MYVYVHHGAIAERGYIDRKNQHCANVRCLLTLNGGGVIPFTPHHVESIANKLQK